MTTSSSPASRHPLSETEPELGSADFGDERLTNRGVKIFNSLIRNPQASINGAMIGGAETNAAYRFFDNEKVTSESILTPHRERTIERAAQFRSIRVIQDTSEIDYTNVTSLEGVGPLANKGRRGIFLHVSLVTSPEGLPLGVRSINPMIRNDADRGKRPRSESVPIEKKESFRWLRDYCDACELQERLPGTEVISLADREADIFEIFQEYELRKRSDRAAAHYVIRAKENRALNGEHEGLKLFDLDTLGEPLGVLEFEVGEQMQTYQKNKTTKKHLRRARTVKQELRAVRISPRIPYRKGSKLIPVEMTVVLAIEIDTPADQRPINWRILTNKKIETFEEAKGIVSEYIGRWQIEVFFKTLKSGCGVEDLQLKTMERMERAISMLSIVAWRQLQVTHLARETPDLPCGEVFEEHEWKATLTMVRRKTKGSLDDPIVEPGLKDYITEVAKLGGYLDRKSDPPPGPESIWRGMAKAQAYGEMWLALQGGE